MKENIFTKYVTLYKLNSISHHKQQSLKAEINYEKQNFNNIIDYTVFVIASSNK